MDPWSSWESDRQQREQEQRVNDERDRHAIAGLLEARGLGKAAVLVAASTYHCEQVDNLDGGHYEGVFAVPASVYDHAATDPIRSTLEDAARAVIGDSQFAGINVTVQRPQPEPGWEQVLARRLFDHQAPDADPAALLALLPGPTSSDHTAAAYGDTHPHTGPSNT